jgi:hypothetical protein
MFGDFFSFVPLVIVLIIFSFLAYQVAKLRGKNEVVAAVLTLATFGCYFLFSLFFLISELKSKTQSKSAQKESSNRIQISIENFLKSEKAIYLIPFISIIASFGIVFKFINHLYFYEALKKEIILVVVIFGSLWYFTKKAESKLRNYSSIFATIIFGLIFYITFIPNIKESLEIKSIITATNLNIEAINNQDYSIPIDQSEIKLSPQGISNKLSDADQFKKVLVFLEMQLNKQAVALRDLELKTSKIPLDTILLPQTLTSENNIRIASNYLIQYASATNEYIKKIEDSRSEYRSAAEGIYGKNSPSIRAFDSTFSVNSQLVTRVKVASNNLYDTYSDMLLLMGRVTKANAVKIDNGFLSFSQNSDLNQYNLLTDKIKKNEEVYLKAIKDYDEASSNFKKKMTDFAN